ncbi:MAG: rRNA pseudouridine synthase [Taibaiella sp.]|nr:rRNA pseudouridine synthase [Taibaiella sp.]
MSTSPYRYFCLNKPYNMLSQFVSVDSGKVLSKLDFDFPEGIHAIGRLDKCSEGLLLLTTDKRITKLLFQSKVPHKRTYLVMVKNIVSLETLEKLRTGIEITISEGARYVTPPCEVHIVEKPADLFLNPKYPFEIWPHTWLTITLTEGKYHQVRKMVNAVRHRCQRLVRISIEDMLLGDLQAGEIREVSAVDFFRLLKLKGAEQLRSEAAKNI